MLFKISRWLLNDFQIFTDQEASFVMATSTVSQQPRPTPTLSSITQSWDFWNSSNRLIRRINHLWNVVVQPARQRNISLSLTLLPKPTPFQLPHSDRFAAPLMENRSSPNWSRYLALGLSFSRLLQQIQPRRVRFKHIIGQQHSLILHVDDLCLVLKEASFAIDTHKTQMNGLFSQIAGVTTCQGSLNTNMFQKEIEDVVRSFISE